MGPAAAPRESEGRRLAPSKIYSKEATDAIDGQGDNDLVSPQPIPSSPACAEQLLIWDHLSSSCLVGYRCLLTTQ